MNIFLCKFTWRFVCSKLELRFSTVNVSFTFSWVSKLFFFSPRHNFHLQCNYCCAVKYVKLRWLMKGNFSPFQNRAKRFSFQLKFKIRSFNNEAWNLPLAFKQQKRSANNFGRASWMQNLKLFASLSLKITQWILLKNSSHNIRSCPALNEEGSGQLLSQFFTPPSQAILHNFSLNFSAPNTKLKGEKWLLGIHELGGSLSVGFLRRSFN